MRTTTGVPAATHKAVLSMRKAHQPRPLSSVAQAAPRYSSAGSQKVRGGHRGRGCAPVSFSFNSTPADPCTDHLILLEHPRAGWRGVAATNCVGLSLKPPVKGGCRLICVVGRHRHRGLGAAAAAASVGWICLLYTHASLLD